MNLIKTDFPKSQEPTIPTFDARMQLATDAAAILLADGAVMNETAKADNVLLLPAAPFLMEQYEQASPHNRYRHLTFFGRDSAELAQEAWRIHAEGYHAMGFVHQDAVTPEGFLTTDIDKARGDNVEYYLALNPDTAADRASIRKIHLSEGQTYKDLPAYALCHDYLSENGVAVLEAYRDAGAAFKEMGALARTKGAHPLAVHEIFRKIIHDANGSNEVWFLSIVSTTYESLAKSFGDVNFPLLGADVPIDDERVSDSIKLRATLVNPNTFIDNVADAYLNADTIQSKARFARSLLFFTDSLPSEKLSDKAQNARQILMGASINHYGVGA